METNNGKKIYSIDSIKWPEAEKWGWGISTQQIFDFEPEGEPSQMVRNFVQTRMPAICEIFYNTILDGLMAAGIDSGHAIEFVEEELAFKLDEFLIEIAHEYCRDLIKERK